MFSLLVVALFFLMLLAPCLFALRMRWEESSEPAEKPVAAPVSEPVSELKIEAPSLDAVAIAPPKAAPLGTVSALEAEVLAARRLLALCESDVLAAEARLAMARAKVAADHAALASRAAAQAAEAANLAQRSTRAGSERTTRPSPNRYEGPVVDGSNLPDTHPSMDFPRSRVSRRAA